MGRCPEEGLASREAELPEFLKGMGACFLGAGVDCTGPTGSCWEDHWSVAEETSLKREPGSQSEVALPVIREQNTAGEWSMEKRDLKTNSSTARGQAQCQPPIQEALILDGANSIPIRAFPPLGSPSSLCL